MVAEVFSATILGVDAVLINVEIDMSRGLPSFNIVGLPDKAVKESRDRVRSAIENSGYKFPVKKITINLAPANIKKIGPHFDMAIAAGILAKMGVIRQKLLKSFLIVGELSLTGNIRKTKGILPMCLKLKEEKLKGIILPVENQQEARLVEKISVIPLKKLSDLIEFLNHGEVNEFYFTENPLKEKITYNIDFNEIKGQHEAKRAFEISAAGRHNILMIGPPGAGKTMLAKRMRTILPPLTEKEQLELTKIYSIMGLVDCKQLIKERPFRAPSNNITTAGLLGGGKIPHPGEISLAHHGTLFLDELPQFKRKVLEALRRPLERGKVKIVRSQYSAVFPAKIMLIGAMNPCPCGYYGDNNHECTCSVTKINNYRSKISGPLLDRIDLHIEVPALNVEEIIHNKKSESSHKIRKRVLQTHNIQLYRYEKENFNYNSRLHGKKIKKYCFLTEKCRIFLKYVIQKLNLSARAYDKILKVSRTIADLDGEQNIKKEHLAEAVQYRSLERRVI